MARNEAKHGKSKVFGKGKRTPEMEAKNKAAEERLRAAKKKYAGERKKNVK